MFDTSPSWGRLALLAAIGALSGAACTPLDVGAPEVSQGGTPGGGGTGFATGGSSNSGATTAQAGSANPDGGASSTAGVGSGGASPGDAGGALANADSGAADSSADPAPSEYLLLDFAGASTSSELRTIIDWDLRERFTFDVSGSHTTSATMEVVNSQAALSFAQADPDPSGTEDVLRFVKIPTATGDGENWGGWAHIIVDLGSAIPQQLVSALPQWDNAGASTVAGTKVIQLDVYYDDTVDPNFDWDDLLVIENAGTDVWNAVTAQGYKVDLHLVNYANHANDAGAHDSGGIYIGYSAYLTQPNTWVTLTFQAADEGRAENFFSAGALLAASASQVTGIDIKPSGGYEARDSNPVYIRNLRIVDAP